MPRKKSVKKEAAAFIEKVDSILEFVEVTTSESSAEHTSWINEYAVVRLYREFERLVLGAIIGAVNNDTATISETTGVDFPKHLTDEVCEYLVVGQGYFDFKGRDGLIKTTRQFVPPDHYLLDSLRKAAYKKPLAQLTALRNFAAHASRKSKKAALEATGQKRISTAGAWLKTQDRLVKIADGLKNLANEIEESAPY